MVDHTEQSHSSSVHIVTTFGCEGKAVHIISKLLSWVSAQMAYGRLVRINPWDEFVSTLSACEDVARRAAVLGRGFYDDDVRRVAGRILGKLLVREIDGRICGGIIVEAEAYLASGDPANHAYRGLTERNRSMFGPPGHAYVYRIHQQHCLNVVTEPEGIPSAVLIRAIQPVWGVEIMLANRGKGSIRGLTDGPGKVCQALKIDLRYDGWDLTLGKELWLAELPDEFGLPEFDIAISERVGVTAAKEMLLRFFIFGNQFVSKPIQARKLVRCSKLWANDDVPNKW